MRCSFPRKKLFTIATIRAGRCISIQNAGWSLLWLVDQNLNSELEKQKTKFVFLGGESGCDFCMLFCNFFSTMPSVERLFENVVMVQNS